MNIFSTLWGNIHNIIVRGHDVMLATTNIQSTTATPSDTLPAAITIQRFVRQHRTSVDSLDTELTNEQASRVYLTHYPTEYLLRLPDFVAKKARPDLVTWVDSNIPPPEMRTRRDVRNFFVKSGVRYEDVVYAGW